MKNYYLLFLLFFTISLSACFQQHDNVVNIYTHRHYEADELIYKAFTQKTGIKVNVVKSAADQLIGRLELEGENTPADVLITVDAGRLWRAKEKGLLQPFENREIDKNIPSHLKDTERYWIALSYRARVIAYNKTLPQQILPADYEDLSLPEWSKKFLPRSSSSEYNQSLMAALIMHLGESKAREWCENITKNFMRIPKGNDTDIIKEIAQGNGEIGIINSYYLAKLKNSKLPEDRNFANKVGLIFPNQNSYGTHVNISGIGILKYSKNKENAEKLLAFLTDEYAQKKYMNINYEYPANDKIAWNNTLMEWGKFKADTIDLMLLGKNNLTAVKIFDTAQWF